MQLIVPDNTKEMLIIWMNWYDSLCFLDVELC